MENVLSLKKKKKKGGTREEENTRPWLLKHAVSTSAIRKTEMFRAFSDLIPLRKFLLNLNSMHEYFGKKKKRKKNQNQ